VLLVFEVCAGFHLAQIAEKSINTIEILIVCFEVTERLSRDNREGVFLSESPNDFFANVTMKYSQNIFSNCRRSAQKNVINIPSNKKTHKTHQISTESI
jgi:hypothetical protein